jgi:hypothetical protein
VPRTPEGFTAIDHEIERQPKAPLMQTFSPRHVKTEEALRLGVESGWYAIKVSGTFVSGPHDSEADCNRKIDEINPPAVKKKR